MNLLVVSYRIYPDASAEGINTAKLLGSLQAAGHRTTLVTSDHNELPPDVETPDTPLFRDVRVVRCPRADRRGLSARAPLRWWSKYRWRGVSGIPPEAWAWVDRASEAAVELWRTGDFDWVYTRAMKFWSHLVGLRLKEVGAPWVAHFGDPWPASLHASRDEPARRAHTRTESAQIGALHRVLDTADALTFPSRLLGRHLLSTGGRPHLEGKTFVVPHLMPVEEPIVDPPPESQSMILLHAGSLRGPRRPGMPARNVTVLMEGLRRFLDAHADARGRVALHLLGSMDVAARRQVEAMHLGDTVLVLPRLPYERLIPALRAASALVLLDVDLEESPYPPSKLPDYLAAGRPIIALTPARSDIRETLGDDGALYARPDDPAAVAAALALAWNAWNANTLQARVTPSGRLGYFASASIIRTLETIDRTLSREAA